MNYVTPTEYKELAGDTETRSLEHLRELSRSNATCENCGQPAWRLGGVGLCFTCTTGEADDSNDYELIPED